MDVTTVIYAVANALETVPTFGADNCKTMGNCIDTLREAARAIETARQTTAEEGQERDG